MAIITCSECGQNPVSDRAATCPKCGCPIAGGNAAVDAAAPPTESTDQSAAIREARIAQLAPLSAVVDSSNAEFPDSSVAVQDLAKLAEVVGVVQGWCEELVFMTSPDNFVHKRHIDQISRVSALKSLQIFYEELDDETLYGISKIQTLIKFEISMGSRRTTAAGWYQLAKLSRLEFLRLPSFLIPGEGKWAEDDRIRQELQRMLPRTVIK